LIELLENAILSRFPKMTLKEIQKMIQLTPLDKTVAGQELIMMGIERGRIQGLTEGRTEGIRKGKIIGKIHATQRFLKLPITPEKKLLEQSMKELSAMLKQLEAKLN
jgi:predicted transposase YdaD